ncbi:Cyclin-C [Clonorchis sinensis]|uniref:Cyclin-C n=1 Tax=Clonorchis sinensis TaxID=79923 RepID=A0A8T1MVQ6_CLOSI|nr:Cyclin-C [Clonorchis sinensis]
MARSYWRSSNYLEWLLDRQDVMVHRVGDLKILGSEEDYQKVMLFFGDVIQALGKSVEVRQQVIATATVYFKRFYSRHSLKAIDPWLMAPSCLFLASKVEEFGVLSQKNLLASCRQIIATHYSAYFPDGFGYPYRAQDILECEFILLEAMDCSLIVFHPYRPLVQFCEELRPQLHELADLLLERAWWVVNDSFRTDVCFHFPPYIVALGCLQTAFVLLSNNTDLLAGVSGSSGLSNTSSRHAYSAHQPQQSVNPLVVADRWFSELNVDMEKVWEVTRHLLNLYDLWRRFDEANEMPNLLLKKIPRPVVQPPHNPQSSSFPNTSNVQPNAITGAGSGASQSSASLSGGGGQGQQPPPGHTAAQLLAATTVGGAGSSGAGSNIITEAQPPLHHHNQPTRTAPGGGQVRMHPQQAQQQQHLGAR